MLNETYLPQALYSSDNDYNASHFIEILEHYEDYLNDSSPWDGGENDWYAYFDKQGNITIADMNDEENSRDDEIFPSITMPISDFKTLLIDYRNQAKEFRKKVPEMQKAEDERRLLDKNTFGF